ncbi:MAG: homoserine kinase [Vicinamibacterales bacterium]
MAERVRVFAPASISNIGPGFDVLGMALNEPGDFVDAEISPAASGVEIVEITGDGGLLSRSASENVAAIAAAAVLGRFSASMAEERALAGRGFFGGVRLWVHKQMPLASGMGSSAASSVAGAFAVNELLGRPFTRLELLPCALEGERAASGAAHADNVAPSLLGGAVLVRSYDPLEVVQLPTPPGLVIVVVRPHCSVATAAARAIIRDCCFPIPEVVANLGNLGALVAALYRGDLPLLGRAIEDRLVEPRRVHLIPGFAQVRTAALTAGALGCSISGAGPSVFAMAEKETAHDVGAAMRAAFAAAGLESDAYIGGVNSEGARRIAT